MTSFLVTMRIILSQGGSTLPAGRLHIPSELSQDWEALSDHQQDELVDSVKAFFGMQGRALIKYTPILGSGSEIYRPVTCVPKTVIRTLLSGEQDLASLSEEGSSCQWMHVFGENDGIAFVEFTSAEDVTIARKRPRSRSRSEEKRCCPKEKKDDSKKKKTARRRPRFARQTDVGFFPHVLSETASRFVDLKYAQIFCEGQSQYEVQHCLTSTLEYFGVEDPSVLADIFF